MPCNKPLRKTLFACPPNFFINTVIVFSWNHCKSQGELETTLMQDLGGGGGGGGQTKSIMVFSEVAY